MASRIKILVVKAWRPELYQWDPWNVEERANSQKLLADLHINTVALHTHMHMWSLYTNHKNKSILKTIPDIDKFYEENTEIIKSRPVLEYLTWG